MADAKFIRYAGTDGIHAGPMQQLRDSVLNLQLVTVLRCDNSQPVIDIRRVVLYLKLSLW